MSESSPQPPSNNTAGFSDFLNLFKETNSAVFSTEASKKAAVISKNISLVDEFIKMFMGSSATQAEIDALTSKTPMATTTIESDVPPLPSYNVRTPHVEVWINGFKVVYSGQKDDPSTYTITQSGNTNIAADLDFLIPKIDVLFKNLDLSMPFGGPFGTIKGTLQLFSREPLDFLNFLFQCPNSLDEISGLPTVKLRFGWALGNITGDEAVNKILSPAISCLVMNVQMEDPVNQHQGSTFTLTLQDMGSAAYENSSADFGIDPNFPQQQLRQLLEGVFKKRLFTLDDLLYMTDSGSATSVTLPQDKLDTLKVQDLDINNDTQFQYMQDVVDALVQADKGVNSGEQSVGFGINGITIKNLADLRPGGQVTLSSQALDKNNFSIATLTELCEAFNLGTTRDKQISDYANSLISQSKYREFMNSVATGSQYERSRQIAAKAEKNVRKGLPKSYAFFTVTKSSLNDTYSTASQESDAVYWGLRELYSYYYDKKYPPNNGASSITWEVSDILKDAARQSIAITNGVYTMNNALYNDVKKVFNNFSTEQTPEINSKSSVKILLQSYIKVKGINYVNMVYKRVLNRNLGLLANTFFVNGKNPPLRINGLSFKEVIEDLLMNTQCRWFPTSNAGLNTAISESSVSNAMIQQKVSELNSLTSARVKDEAAIQKLTTEVAELRNNKSYSCKLVYLPDIPTKYKTSSNNLYISEQEMTTGGFLLIPNLTPMDLTELSTIPLVYGPGGSSHPYLYGGAQNIRQIILDKGNLLPQIFGEVIDAKVNLSSLVAFFKGSFNEKAVLLQSGQAISKYLPGSTNTSNKTNELKIESQKRREWREKQMAAYKELLAEKLANLPPGAGPEYFAELSKKKLQELQSSFMTNFAVNGSLYPNRQPLFKADPEPPTTSGEAYNREYKNPVNAIQSAKDALAQRFATFLYSPITISMSVMGDPFLVRQGIGSFELQHFYVEKDGVSLRYNYLMSGQYMATELHHSISPGHYITNIKGCKIPPSNNTFSSTINTWRVTANNAAGATGLSADTSADISALNAILSKGINFEVPATDTTSTNYNAVTRILGAESAVLSTSDLEAYQLLQNRYFFGSDNPSPQFGENDIAQWRAEIARQLNSSTGATGTI